MAVLGVSSFISDFPQESPITACKAFSIVSGWTPICIINICNLAAAAIARMTADSAHLASQNPAQHRIQVFSQLKKYLSHEPPSLFLQSLRLCPSVSSLPSSSATLGSALYSVPESTTTEISQLKNWISQVWHWHNPWNSVLKAEDTHQPSGISTKPPSAWSWPAPAL